MTLSKDDKSVGKKKDLPNNPLQKNYVNILMDFCVWILIGERKQ